MREKTKYFYAFGPYILDTAQHLVLREGKPVPLTPKTYDALLFLVENSGRMLSKDELMKALWPDSFVDESNLAQQISTIRKALGDGAGKDRYIVTVPGRGYRFAGLVTEWSEEAEPEWKPATISTDGAAPAPALAAPDITKPAPRRARQILLLALAALGIVLLVLAFVTYRKKAITGRPVEGLRSLAILPFQSLRHDPNNDFLGFSLVDAVITKLGYINSLTVRPSYAVAQYRNQINDIQKIAADLRVDTLLTGSFVREGEDLRITSQLIDVKTEKILWRNTFDLKYEKLLTVQDNVAREIIKGLALSLSRQEGERIKPDKPIDPLTYEYYLRGVDLYARNDFPLAIKMLEKSAELDPGYAPTWAHLGRAYTANASFQFGGREEYRKAQAVYEKALSLQPAQMDAEIYMANLFTDTGRVEQAVPLLRKALQINPNHAEAHWELGYAYRFGGMLRESAAECERARRLDPSVKLNSSALNTYLYLGEYDKFLASLPKTTDSAFILFYRGFAEYYKGNWRQATNDFQRAFALDASLFQARIGQAISHALERQYAKGLDLLREAETKIEQRGVGDPEAIYKIGQAYAVLGDKVSALRVLRHSVDNGFFPYPYLAADPLLATLRGEAEFERMIGTARQRHEKFKKSLF